MKRIPELDAVRGLAALGVVLFHAFPVALFIGWACVDIFFVLSGFLITRIILQNHDQKNFMGVFLARRALRILPVYYITLGMILLANAASRRGYPLDGLWHHLLFAQNLPAYWGGSAYPFIPAFSPSWSVACEEQYYLLWPLLLAAFGLNSLPWCAFCLVVVSFIMRMFGFSHLLLFAHSDGLALGGLLGWLLGGWGIRKDVSRDPGVRRFLWAAMLCGGSGFVVYGWKHFGDPQPMETAWSILTISVFSAGMIGLLISYSGLEFTRLFRLRILVGLGMISYSLYLSHAATFTYAPVLLRRAGITNSQVNALVTWILVFLLPMLSWFLIEKPLLRLKPGYLGRSSQESSC